MKINGIPVVQIELKTLGINPRRAVEQLDFEFVLFASAVIDYDYIMKLITDFQAKPAGKATMSREQLIGLIAADSKFIDERDAITEYVRGLKAGEGLGEAAIRAGFGHFRGMGGMGMGGGAKDFGLNFGGSSQDNPPSDARPGSDNEPFVASVIPVRGDNSTRATTEVVSSEATPGESPAGAQSDDAALDDAADLDQRSSGTPSGDRDSVGRLPPRSTIRSGPDDAADISRQ